MNQNHLMLSGTNLCKHFQIKSSLSAPAGILKAVDSVSLNLYKGETHGIAGESGCGKSTLGKLLSGLTPYDHGQLSYQGVLFSTMSKEEKLNFRRQTQMIFQDPFSSLNPRMRIGDIISEPLLIAGAGKKEIRAKTEQLMETVGISTEMYNRFPHQFSGGQRQRIGIARALSASPMIIIADEPVSSLDISIQAQIINLLQNMKSAYSLSMIMISHDLSVLRHMCDRVSIMYLGIIVESGPASAIFSRCLHPYTEALIASVPGNRKTRGTDKVILKDDIPSPLAIPPGCRFHTRCRYARDLCRLEVPALKEVCEGHLAACHFSADIFEV
jgi:peptide/nickel transport system ATP-binding protein